jgi:DNA polymerase III delta prime subunit
MAAYDFRNLSAFDFEHLTRDLLQKELKIRLESFKRGRDSGIDFRQRIHARLHAVVQCKHFVDSGYSKLLSHLKRAELPKVQALKPKRYLLATSVGLTPRNKDEVAAVFAPYCQKPDDVFGADDLNNLLGMHPEVEQAHFKLWLTSTGVLEALLNSDLINESKAERQRIERRLRLYVQHGSYHRARELLEKHHYCIVAGQPGIGKSTLAEILTVAHLGHGYEVVVISNDIRDAFRLHNPTRKQLFVYDDFLGTTALEAKLHKNEEDALLRLVDSVSHGENTRLLLTTREYILNQARQVHEKLADAKIDIARCTITVDSYTKVERAAILHNHIWFSALPQEYRAALLVKKAYNRILAHENYVPRIVKWMTDPGLAASVKPSEYVERFVYNLDHPRALWEHAFDHQLSDKAQHLLMTAWTVPAVGIRDLERAFDGYRTSICTEYSISRSPNDFRHALKELEQAFLSVSMEGVEGGIEGQVVRFLHPSVIDFLEYRLGSLPREMRRLADSAVAFEQIERLWVLARSSKAYGELEENLWAASSRLFASSNVLLVKTLSGSALTARYLPRGRSREGRLRVLIRHCPSTRPEVCEGILEEHGRAYFERLKDGDRPEASGIRSLMEEVVQRGLNIGVGTEEMHRIVKDALLTDCLNTAEVECLAYLASEDPALFSSADCERLEAELHSFVEWHVSDESDKEELDRADEALSRLGALLKVPVEGTRELIAERREELDRQVAEQGDQAYDEWKDSQWVHESEEALVDSMFEVFAGDEPRDEGDEGLREDERE